MDMALVDMALAPERAQQPLRKLRKALKSFPGDPSAEEVHKLRTQTRRLEAVLAALQPHSTSKARRLLKVVTPVRKAAGEVRDMDVLVANSLTLTRSCAAGSENSEASLVRLIEHLGGMRMKSAGRLSDTVVQGKKDVRRRLKQYEKLIARRFPGKGGREVPQEKSDGPAVDAVAVALNLTGELARWPGLSAKNIHPFRIELKKLRYVLQMAEGADGAFIEVLGKVKDRIGDWHDWRELGRIGAEVLDPEAGRLVLKTIEEIGEQKLKQALAESNAMRKQYLGANVERGGRKMPRSAHSQNSGKTPALATVAKLAS